MPCLIPELNGYKSNPGCVPRCIDLGESLAAEMNRPSHLDKILSLFGAPSRFLNVSLLRKIQRFELPAKHFVLGQFESEVRTVAP